MLPDIISKCLTNQTNQTNMKLLDKLKKTGAVESTTLADSTFFNSKEEVVTEIPALNIALAGRVDGGLTPGVLQVCGFSKSFKTTISLYMVAAYMRKHPEAVCIFYDTEYGATPDAFRTYGIDIERVLHIPVLHIEQLKFDLVKKLEEISVGDKVIVFIDSIGNAASKKELDDANDEKSVADLSRSKSLKSFWRIVTPQITGKQIPLIAINHVYQSIGAYVPTTVVGGGTGGIYSASAIWIITKAQEKEGTDLVGFKFTINIEKSRTVIEKSKIPLIVSFENGIDKYSGMLDLLIDSGMLIKSGSWYQTVDPETGEVAQKKIRSSDLTDEQYEMYVNSDKFKDYIQRRYRLAYAQNNKRVLDDSNSIRASDIELDDDEE